MFAATIILPGSTISGQATITAGPCDVAFHPGLVTPSWSSLEAASLWANSKFHCLLREDIKDIHLRAYQCGK